MSTRLILIASMLGAAAVLSAGCGPSQAALEARAKAHQRLDRVNAEISYDKALHEFESGQFDKAAKGIAGAIRANPESAQYRLLEGRIFLETHRLERALESFKSAIELDPKLADAYYYSGVVHQRWSADTYAYESYLAAWDINPESVAYLLATAESLIALHRLDDARQLVGTNLARFEHNWALRHLLGRIAMIEGDAAAAAELYEEARRLNPDVDELLEELVDAQFDAGLYGPCLESVTELESHQTEPRDDLMQTEARCLVQLQRETEARALYLKLKDLRPNDPEVFIELGALAWDIGDFHRVAFCGARVAALAPERFEGYLLKGVNERHHDNTEEAIQFLREATKRADGDSLPYLVLGRVLDESGDAAGALEAYTAAVQVEPSSGDAQALLADLQERELATADPGVVRNE